jgi:hypothetical protein
MSDWQAKPTAASSQSSDATEIPGTLVPSVFPGDRRRTPRLTPRHPTQVELSAVMDIEVLDLSETGVLLACDCVLDIGHRTQVRILLGREPFVAWIEVKRIAEIKGQSGRSPGRYLVGAVFTSVDDHSARALRQFLPSRPELPPRSRLD